MRSICNTAQFNYNSLHWITCFCVCIDLCLQKELHNCLVHNHSISVLRIDLVYWNHIGMVWSLSFRCKIEGLLRYKKLEKEGFLQLFIFLNLEFSSYKTLDTLDNRCISTGILSHFFNIQFLSDISNSQQWSSRSSLFLVLKEDRTPEDVCSQNRSLAFGTIELRKNWNLLAMDWYCKTNILAQISRILQF